jgi:hypothetical protein
MSENTSHFGWKAKLSPTFLYFWKHFPFWMKNQINPNFPLFLEILRILDEKPRPPLCLLIFIYQQKDDSF